MAMGGGFRYETLLRIRRQKEEQRARDVAAALDSLRVGKHQHEEILDRQREVLVAAGARMKESFDARDVGLYYQFERHLARQAVAKAAHIVELKGNVVEKQKAFEEAVKGRRIVETLKVRGERAYRAALQRAERGVIDEVASTRAAARGRRKRGLS